MVLSFNLTNISPLVMQLTAFVPTAIMLAFGLVGNLAVLITVVKHRSNTTKMTIYYLIGNLAFYDILFLILVWPIELIKKSVPWPFGMILCYILNIFPLLCNAGSALTLILIAIDRYQVLAKTTNPNKTNLTKILTLVGILIVAIGIACPDIIFTGYAKVYHVFLGSSSATHHPIQTCFIYLPGLPHSKIDPWHIYFLTLYLVLYILPLCIGLYLYCYAMFHLRQHSASSPSVYLKEQQTLLKLLLVLLLSYVALWTPEYIFYFLWHFQSIRFNVSLYRKHLYIHLLCQLIATCKSVINPFISAHFLPELKTTFRYIFRFRWMIKPINIPQDGSSNDMITLTTTVSRSSII